MPDMDTPPNLPPTQHGKIERLLVLAERMAADIAEIRKDQKTLTATVHQHDIAIAVLCEWKEAVTPVVASTSDKVVDLRVEIAKYASLGAAMGAGFGLITAIAQLFL